MSRAIEIPVGTRFGWLVTTSEPYRIAETDRRHVDCRCERCGAVCAPTVKVLRNGSAISCGCWRAERKTTHGMHRRPEYRVWADMLSRCRNPHDDQYRNYGGRPGGAIRVCRRWESFENFMSDMGQRPPGRTVGGMPLYTLDRIDNEGGYEPGNCRWATWHEQKKNQRRRMALSPEEITLIETLRREALSVEAGIPQ